ncbi:hypothetical protein ABPG73_020202 [Tetrahymena malaccensis]
MRINRSEIGYKQQLNLNHKEKQFRLLMIFCPFGFTLIFSILLYTLLMGFTTIFPMINDLESYILDKEIQLLKMQLYMEKIKQQMSFSRIQSFTQILAGFSQSVILQSSFEQVVSWQDLSTENVVPKLNNLKKTNFIVSNEYLLDDFCNLREELCQNDSSCQSLYDEYFNQYEQLLSNVTYYQSQYVGWNHDNSTTWEDLLEEQKKFIILSSFLRSIVYPITQNRIQEDLQITEVYYARNEDSLALFYGFGNRLFSMSSIDNLNFGGPFSCQKNNGQYQKYKYKSVDQFNGFQYYDYSNQYCGNQTQNHLCLCVYNNYKRLYPVDWRCRPWFISSNASYAASFADPFINLRNNQLMNTCSYKIIDWDQQNNISLENQQKLSAHSIITVQFDFTRLKLNDNLTDKDGNIYGYQYIVAPKQFNNDLLQGYYQYTTMAHPQIDLTKKTSIIELEYENSINKQEEIDAFIQNTPFLNNINPRKQNCDEIFKAALSDKDIVKMNKNGTQYDYLFADIVVCTGNLFEQNSITVGYLSRAVETNYAKRYSNEIKKKMFDILYFYLIIEISLFIIIFSILYICTNEMLIVNFEKPIQILNKFLNEADPQSVQIFHDLVQKNQLKTQLELKNLIKAIHNAVIGIQKKVASYLNPNSSNLLDIQKVLDTFKQGIQDYQIFQHQEGIGMCCNNVASILIIEQKYQESLYYMQKAYILQEQIFRKKIPQNNMNFKDIVLKLCKTVNEMNFMHILACRKLQLANIINMICESEDLDTFNYFNDHFALEKVRKNSSVNQFKRNKMNAFESPLSQKSQKNVFIDFEDSEQKIQKSIDDCMCCKSTVNREMFFSEKFYMKQLMSQNQIEEVQEDQMKHLEKILKDKKSLLTQAKELLYESYVIFKCLHKEIKKKKKQKQTEINKIYLKSIYSIILLVKCHIIFDIKSLIIKELFQLLKRKLQKAIKSQKYQNQTFFFILQQKYYNLRGVYFNNNGQTYKALASYIKALNYRWYCKMHCLPYDSYEAYQSLLGIQDLIDKNNINLSTNQSLNLQNDIQKLKQIANENNKEQLYFLEILFDDEQEIKKRYSVFTPNTQLNR